MEKARVKTKLQLLAENPYHPSLRTKKNQGVDAFLSAASIWISEQSGIMKTTKLLLSSILDTMISLKTIEYLHSLKPDLVDSIFLVHALLLELGNRAPCNRRSKTIEGIS